MNFTIPQPTAQLLLHQRGEVYVYRSFGHFDDPSADLPCDGPILTILGNSHDALRDHPLVKHRCAPVQQRLGEVSSHMPVLIGITAVDQVLEASIGSLDIFSIE